MNTILSRLEDFSIVNSSSHDVVHSDKISSITDAIVDSAPDIQLERDNAYQKGYDAAINEQKIYWEHKIETLNMANCNEIAKQNEEFAVRTSEYISVAIKDSIKLVLNSLENDIGRILGAILEQGIARKASVELAEFVADVLKKGECGVITIHCPKNLHSLIQQHLGEYAPMVCYEYSDTVELSTRISGSLITTRLESLFDDVKKILD